MHVNPNVHLHAYSENLLLILTKVSPGSSIKHLSGWPAWCNSDCLIIHQFVKTVLLVSIEDM